MQAQKPLRLWRVCSGKRLREAESVYPAVRMGWVFICADLGRPTRFWQLEMEKEFLGKKPRLEPWSAETITVGGRETENCYMSRKGSGHRVRDL